ncbi:MAG TPA: hypothetical protein VH482_35405 [Thermomicrobiales bacterium]|jgi:hypothetical protein
MHSQIMVEEMVKAVRSERNWRNAEHHGSTRSYGIDKGGLAAGAQYMMGRALVRAGRYLQRGAAPRPEPLGS